MTTWLIVIGAALVGAFLRAATSTSQSTWTWQSAVDTAMGGVASVAAYVILGVLPWTAATITKLDTATEQALVVASISYVASHVWVNRGADWLGALGDKMTGRSTK